MPLAIVPLSLASVGVAVAAVAALFALHHLRTEPARRPVATLIFWRAAVGPRQPRVLGSARFTHRRTFALLTAIVVLTAAALTAGRWGNLGADDRRDVVVIDAGVAMTAVDSTGHTLLHRAVDAASADLGRLSATPALIAAGDQPTLLSRGDEPTAVVRRRLGSLVPEAGASESALALELAGSLQSAIAGDIYWYTAQTSIPPGLPNDVAKRVRLHHVAAAEAVAIVGVTFQAAADDPCHGALTVRCAGQSLRPLIVKAQVDGDRSLARPAVVHDGSAGVTFDHLPADGRSVAIDLVDAPGPAATHSASFRLPDQQPLTFRFMGNVPSALRAVALALGTETNAGRIVVAGPGTPLPADVIAAVVVVDQGPPLAAGQRLAFAAAAPWGSGLSLEDSVAEGPALSSPGRAVLVAGGATVAALDELPGRRTLYLSQGLVGPAADLPRRAAYPVLLERLCRELAGRSAPSLATTLLRRAQDPLWPGPTNALKTADAPITLPDPPPPPAVSGLAGADLPAVTPAGRGVPWTEVVLALALTLSVAEGLLLAARKII